VNNGIVGGEILANEFDQIVCPMSWPIGRRKRIDRVSNLEKRGDEDKADSCLEYEILNVGQLLQVAKSDGLAKWRVLSGINGLSML
jgi:hypothetical protein